MSARLVFAAALLALASGSSLTAQAEDRSKEVNLKGVQCPVSGRAAQGGETVSYMGKTVYFCCPGCPGAFKKNPAKFAAKAKMQFLETKQMIQVACPVSGRAIDESTAVEFGATKIAFCCPNCQKKFAGADEAGKLKIVMAKFDKTFTPQTLCPLSGKPIEADVSVKHEGKMVYFCCPGCVAGFQAKPEKYVGKLPQFAQAKEKAEK